MLKQMANTCSCGLSNMLMLIVEQVLLCTNTAGQSDETQLGLLFGEVGFNHKAELTNVDISLAGTLDFKISRREDREIMFYCVSRSISLGCCHRETGVWVTAQCETAACLEFWSLC